MRIGAGVVLLAAALASACASDGAWVRSRERTMLRRVPADVEAKVVVLEMTGEGRGTLSITEAALTDLRNTPGVLDADRGGGNEALLLVKADLDPSYLADVLRPRYTTRVVRVDTAKDLAE